MYPSCGTYACRLEFCQPVVCRDSLFRQFQHGSFIGQLYGHCHGRDEQLCDLRIQLQREWNSQRAKLRECHRARVEIGRQLQRPERSGAITVCTNSQILGDYVVRFDTWLNVNGPFPEGGSGSTNYLTAGVGSNGTTNNHVTFTGNGGWTAVNGENGNGTDYRLYKDATLQGVATAQYAAGTASNARNGLHGYYDQFGSVNVSNLPVQGVNNGGPAQQNGISYAGSFGMAWHTVR
jgi:hypothetical protein